MKQIIQPFLNLILATAASFAVANQQPAQPTLGHAQSANERVEASAAQCAKHLAEIQRRVLAGDKVDARDYGKIHLTQTPTSFRSDEPLAELVCVISVGS